MKSQSDMLPILAIVILILASAAFYWSRKASELRVQNKVFLQTILKQQDEKLKLQWKNEWMQARMDNQQRQHSEEIQRIYTRHHRELDKLAEMK